MPVRRWLVAFVVCIFNTQGKVKMTMQIEIIDNNGKVGSWAFGDKTFKSGRVGYFVNGCLNVRLNRPVVTVKDSDGEVLFKFAASAREFKSTKQGWYDGGPEWVIANEEGMFQFSFQVITSAPNRHRFQAMAYSTQE